MGTSTGALGNVRGSTPGRSTVTPLGSSMRVCEASALPWTDVSRFRPMPFASRVPGRLLMNVCAPGLAALQGATAASASPKPLSAPRSLALSDPNATALPATDPLREWFGLADDPPSAEASAKAGTRSPRRPAP